MTATRRSSGSSSSSVVVKQEHSLSPVGATTSPGPVLSTTSSPTNSAILRVKKEKKSPSLAKSTMSEYEQLRLENIARNEEFLKSLGIDPNARKVQQDVEDQRKKEIAKQKRKEQIATKRKRDEEFAQAIANGELDPNEVLPAAVRRSRRISEQPAEVDIAGGEVVEYWANRPSRKSHEPYVLDIQVDDEDDPDYGREKITASMIRELIQSTNPEHDELITNEAITHTAYRMSYMSNEKLATRLKAIAR